MSAAALISMPKKFPIWLPRLGTFIATRRGINIQRDQIDQVVSAMQTNYLPFRESAAKKPVVKTDEQKAAAKAQKYERQATDKTFWENMAISPSQDPEVRRVAKRKVEQISAIENAKKKTSAKSVLNEIVADLEEADAAEDTESSQKSEYTPHTNFLEPHFAAPQETSESSQDDNDSLADESSPKRRKIETHMVETLPLRTNDYGQTGATEKLVFKSRSTEIKFVTTPKRKQILAEALAKKAKEKKYLEMKQKFHKSALQSGIGADEEVFKIFDQMFEAAMEQNEALNCVDALIKCSVVTP